MLAGPWCWALAPQRQAAAARAFWSLVSATPSIDWLVVCDPLSPDGVTLPPHWGEGYRNVWVGAKLHQASASSALAKLRSLPARLRFVVTKPVLGDVGELDFTGIGWVVVQVAEGTRRADDEWVTSIKLQAMAFGVPTWLDAPGEGGLSHSMQIREEPRPTQ